MSGKRYFWLKLKEDFFTSKRIKKLRKLAGGDTYTIIYLKMQLLSLKTDGILKWSGLEDNFADELALDLDESPENVRVTLQYLLSCGLAETDDNSTFFLPWVAKNTGAESAETQRWRDWRDRKALESNTAPTLPQQTANADKDIEKEKELETESEVIVKRKRFTPPTIDEVSDYCKERGNSVDPQRFIDHYSANGWKVGKNPMRDWKSAVRTWERSNYDRKPTGNKVVSCGWNTETAKEQMERDYERLGKLLKEGKI